MRSRAALVPLLAAACGRGDASPREQAAASRPTDTPPCEYAVKGSESSRDVCVALDTVRKLSGSLGAEAMEVVRRGDTLCVHTGPAGPAVDGEGRVSVVNGRVVALVLTDSTGCG
ncbi:MAG TPA: hypothetical protein VF541_17250 [Longimicrobium sp.]|jgi:hypothetical protein